MAQNLVVKAAGLYLTQNDLSSVPEGAMSIAKNVVIDRDNILEPRRGFGVLSSKLPNSTYKAERFFEYLDELFIRYDSNKIAWYDSSITTFTGTVVTSSATITGVTNASSLRVGLTVTGTGIPDDTFISSIISNSVSLSNTPTSAGSPTLSTTGFRQYTGDFTNPDGELFKLRSTKANQNVYVTTQGGIQKLDALENEFIDSGGIKALESTAELLTTSVNGFMQADSQVAYRVVWGYRDANNNLILGTPSQRVIVVNNLTSSHDISIEIVIPDGVTVDYFYQIYRSGFSASANDEPDDELGLVYEDNPTSSEIANGITNPIVDITPDDLRGATIYTAPSQEGITQANEPPPFAKDIAQFKNSLFYANTKTKQRLNVSLVGVGGNNGLNWRTFTGTYNTSSNSITSISSLAGLEAGMRIDGNGIPAGTTITTVSTSNTIIISNTPTASGTAGSYTGNLVATDVLTINGLEYTGGRSKTTQGNYTTSSNSITLTTGNTLGLLVGQPVSGTGIPDNTIINSISASNALSLSNTPTAAVSASGTITFEGVAFQSSSTSSIYYRRFEVSDNASAAIRITDTSNSLINVVNRSPANSSVYGFYLSGFGDLPGQILFEERDINASSFSITISSHRLSFNPVLPSTGDSISSTNDEFINAIYFSKTNEPEAVPILNFLRVGSANEAILRIIALREALFIFKEDGIFRLTGEDPGNFRVDQLDNTSTLEAPDSAVAFNNQIYMFSDQGITTVTDTGVSIISRPIEVEILNLLANPNFATKTFAFGYETDRKYILFTVSNSTDTEATQAYVFNVFTNTWTKWDLTKQAGFVFPTDDKIYLAPTNSNTVNIERKSLTFRDYYDDTFDVNIASISSSINIKLSSTVNIDIGDLFYQDINRYAVITAKDNATNRITVNLNRDDWLVNFSGSASNAIYTTSSNTISNLSSTNLLKSGMIVTGTGIPVNTTIANITSSTAISISNTPTVAVSSGGGISFSSTGASQIFKSYESEVEFTPQFGKNPGILKQFRDMSMMFKDSYLYSFRVGFSSDLSNQLENVDFEEQQPGTWGLIPWGQFAWGGNVVSPSILRTYVPKFKQRCSQLKIRMRLREAYSFYRLNGFSLIFTNISERLER